MKAYVSGLTLVLLAMAGCSGKSSQEQAEEKRVLEEKPVEVRALN